MISGQPNLHLLTTGWTMFVGAKGLSSLWWILENSFHRSTTFKSTTKVKGSFTNRSANVALLRISLASLRMGRTEGLEMTFLIGIFREPHARLSIAKRNEKTTARMIERKIWALRNAERCRGSNFEEGGWVSVKLRFSPAVLIVPEYD
ncbi:hypothetical protein L1987_18048 [Smallanthus sonchifolius]|uniref:Uncharacterized protein n=1 Tax=Smallanthus sonchifolius TaxID=185202 RepID=A0ACB9J060_9ASTR|nr:hypothetical protein L1987_18048 [Smallanthus sonchifolius]